MMSTADHHSDPVGEALSYSSQRAAQIGSLVAAGVEMGLRRRALSRARRDARGAAALRAAQDQERAAREQAKAGWAPAHDPRWLAQADVIQAAGAWGAAAPYADADPAAASAMRRSEDRLRFLHPYAMARYDRLRQEGAGPLDAMNEAAPLFARAADARPGQASPRQQIGTGPATAQAGPASGTVDDAGLAQPSPAQDQDVDPGIWERGRRIAAGLQARARAERGRELNRDELITALEAATSLPAEVIARLADADNEDRKAARAERARAADLGRASAAGGAGERGGDLAAALREGADAATSAAHAAADRHAAVLAAESFPCTAADGIRAAAGGGLDQQARAKARTAVSQSRRPGLSA
jgi:hypothetical protein